MQRYSRFVAMTLCLTVLILTFSHLGIAETQAPEGETGINARPPVVLTAPEKAYPTPKTEKKGIKRSTWIWGGVIAGVAAVALGLALGGGGDDDGGDDPPTQDSGNIGVTW